MLTFAATTVGFVYWLIIATRFQTPQIPSNKLGKLIAGQFFASIALGFILLVLLMLFAY